MESIDLTNNAEIAAVCAEIKALGEIRKERCVSVIRLEKAPEIVNFSKPNGNGTVYGVKGNKILWTHTWDGVREIQAAKGVKHPNTVTAQAILTGSEEMIVFVENHTGSQEFISMVAFMCGPHETFDNFAEVCIWTKRLEVRNKIKKLFS